MLTNPERRLGGHIRVLLRWHDESGDLLPGLSLKVRNDDERMVKRDDPNSVYSESRPLQYFKKNRILYRIAPLSAGHI